MTQTDFLSLLPLISVSGLVLVLMAEIAYRRNHWVCAATTAAGFAVVLLAVRAAAGAAPHSIPPLYVADGFGLFFSALLALASLPVAILAYDYLEKRPGYREEFYMLLGAATAGGFVLVSATHLASVFVGLELLTVSLFGMIAYTRTQGRSIEAGIKYLVLASVSTAFLLLGTALLYFELGTMEFAEMFEASKSDSVRQSVLLAGIGLAAVGAGFKLALAPFHMWTPDIYEGAPAPVTAYIATVSKGAMTAVLLRVYLMGGKELPEGLVTALTVIAVASMFAGNLLALMQDNVKRILAYSSIAHLGYLIVAFLAGGVHAAEAVVFYLVAYILTALGAFGAISVLSTRAGEPDHIRDYRGLGWRSPMLAAVLVTMLLSLAGIPLTAGFVGKFYLVAAGAEAGTWILLGFLVLNSVIGLYYYLRIVAALYDTDPGDSPALSAPKIALGGGIVLGLILVMSLGFGVYPGPLIDWIRATLFQLS